MSESTPRQAGTLGPLLILGSGVALFASAGALMPAGLRAVRMLTGGTAASWTAYAAGVLLGVAVAGRIAGRTASGRRSATARLMAAELLAAASIAAGPILLRLARLVFTGLWPLTGGHPAPDHLLRFLAIALLVLPSSVAFGLVYLQLAEIVRREDRQGGTADGFVLGLAGGSVALGMVCGGILLQPALGARGTFLVAAGLAGLGAAVGALAVRQGGTEAGEPLPSTNTDGGDDPLLERVVRSAAPLLAGAGLAAAQVAWLRITGLLAGPTESGGLALLTAVTLGLALGGLVASGVGLPAFPWAGAALLALAGGAVYLSMQSVPTIALSVLEYAPQSVGRPVFLGLLAAGMLALPASALAGWGLVRSAAGRAPAGSTTHPRAGTTWFSMIFLGAALGLLLSAHLLVPRFGLRRTLAVAAAAILFASAAALSGAVTRRGLVGPAGALLLVVAGVAAALTPSAWDPRVIAGGIYRYGAGAVARFGSTEQWLAARLRGEGPVYYREGREATVVVERSVQSAPGLDPIDTFTQTVDGRSVAATGTDLRTQVLTGELPPLLHGGAKSALLVDLLTGVTAGSLLTHPIETLTVIDPEPASTGAAALFADLSNRPLEDARLRVVHDDARARLVADPARYDLIVLALAQPARPEGAALLTAEGYALARSRLNPGGLFAERISLGGIPPPALPILLRTFAQSFGSVLVFVLTPDDLLLVGGDHLLRLDGMRLREAVGGNPAIAEDLRRAVVVGANEVIMTLRLDRTGLLKLVGEGSLDGDDRGLVGAFAARHLEVQRHEGLMASIDAGWPGFDALLEPFGTTPDEQGTYLYSLAKSYLGLGSDPVRALDLARLLEAAGQTVKAHWVRGEALLQQRDLDGAVREWKAALAEQPDDIDALFSLGTFHLDSRDYHLAETYLAQAARDHPDSRVVRYHYGRALYNLGKYQRAIEELERATAGEAGAAQYPLSSYFIGLSASQLKRDDRAIAALKEYLEWGHKQSVVTRVEVDAHIKLAEVYERKGKRFDALQERQKAERLRRAIEAYAARYPTTQPERGMVVPPAAPEAGAATPPAGSTAPSPAEGAAPSPDAPATAPSPADGG